MLLEQLGHLPLETRDKIKAYMDSIPADVRLRLTGISALNLIFTVTTAVEGALPPVLLETLYDEVVRSICNNDPTNMDVVAMHDMHMKEIIGLVTRQ